VSVQQLPEQRVELRDVGWCARRLGRRHMRQPLQLPELLFDSLPHGRFEPPAARPVRRAVAETTPDFERRDGDAEDLLHVAGVILRASLELYRPARVRLVRVGGWFDFKWLRFKGKVLGALGVRGPGLVAPPFHPNRVESETVYDRGTGSSFRQVDAAALHERIRSEANLTRFLQREPDGELLAWLGGDSARTGRGSLMVYAGARGRWDTWYLQLLGGPAWRIHRTHGISRAEAEALIRRGRS